MANFQKTVAEFVAQHNLQISPELRYIDLVSEIGELGKEILKASDYGAADFQVTENTTGELGDVLFSLACIANSLDVDMEAALATAIEKYSRRFSAKGTIGSEA